MSSKLSFLKLIDKFLFQKLDEIKQTGPYQKLTSSMNNFTETEYKAISYVSSFIIIIIPFVFVLLLYFSNQTIKNDIEIKNNIFNHINSIIENQSSFKKLGRSILSPTPYQTQAILSSKIKSTLSKHGIDKNKVEIKVFSIINKTEKITKIKTTLEFKELSLEEISKILTDFSSIEKMKFESFSIHKNMTTKLLNGTFSIVHYGKNQ